MGTDPTRTGPARFTLGACVASAALLLCACGPGNFANTNDGLRRENLQLKRSVDELSARLDREVRAQEVLLARQSGAAAPLPEGARPARLVAVTMDRYGSAIDVDGDGRSDLVRLYVYPRDQQDRLLPSAGALTARVLDLAVDPPAALGQATLNPEAFDAAYRDGFTGPYYRVEVPLTALAGVPDGQRPAEVTARVSFAPAVGGPPLTAQREFVLDQH